MPVYVFLVEHFSSCRLLIELEWYFMQYVMGSG